MAKVKTRIYTQKYRKQWEDIEDLKPWLLPVEGDSSMATCKYCKCLLSAKLSDLKKHCKTEKHQISSRPFVEVKQKKINFPKKSIVTENQRCECRLSMYVAVHTSILAVEHLTKVCNLNLNTNLNLQLQRTKCGAIIKNVLGPYFKNLLIQDIGDSPYSLILDESTDISVIKMLGITIRYYSSSLKKINCTFLALVSLEDGTANGIANAVEKILNEFKLNVKMFSGIGTDNASVMVGVNNGVHKILQQTLGIPHLKLIRCVCHSLQLALSKATETLPRNLEFIIRETYNWFSHSSVRRLAYEQVYKTINLDSKPKKILQLASTRWISIEPALKRVLDQWIELKTHFEITRISENCYMSEMLYAMYSDPQNLIFFSFLYPILEEVQKTNKHFESSVADPTKLLLDLKNLYMSIIKKIVNPGAKFNYFQDDFQKYLDPDPYFGYAFESKCNEFKIQNEAKKNLKDRCKHFLIELTKELASRLPDNISVLEQMNLFSIDECLKRNKMSITAIAKEFHADEFIINKIENQWLNLTNINWISKNTLDFWNEVKNYKNSANENPFEELCDLAFCILTLPHSNADVERLFSHMNLVKTKLRNKMQLPLLNSILHIKYGLKYNEKCCHDFQIEDEVLKKIGSMKVYQDQEEEALVLDENETEIIHCKL